MNTINDELVCCNCNKKFNSICAIEIPDKFISINDRYSALKLARDILLKYEGDVRLEVDVIENLYNYMVIFNKFHHGMQTKKYIIKNNIILYTI